MHILYELYLLYKVMPTPLFINQNKLKSITVTYL